MQYFSKFLLRVTGWKAIVSVEEPQKSVICVAPHTSNWDFVIGKLSYWALNRRSSFLIKKSWFVFPFGSFFYAMGGVPIDRSKKNSVTQQMVDEFNKRDCFHLAITPEGTRGKRDKWKMGFYYIALEAGVPIQLAYLDYSKKEMGITQLLYPSGNEEADMQVIRAFYQNVNARFPDRFTRP